MPDISRFLVTHGVRIPIGKRTAFSAGANVSTDSSRSTATGSLDSSLRHSLDGKTLMQASVNVEAAHGEEEGNGPGGGCSIAVFVATTFN